MFFSHVFLLTVAMPLFTQCSLKGEKKPCNPPVLSDKIISAFYSRLNAQVFSEIIHGQQAHQFAVQRYGQ
jgi:hypothetical protein